MTPDNIQMEAQELYPGRIVKAGMTGVLTREKRAAYLAGRKATIEENEKLRELLEEAIEDGFFYAPDLMTSIKERLNKL